MKFELKEHHRNICESDLISDLKEVACKLNKKYVSRNEYEKNGKYSATPYIRTFGTWTNALKIAGLNIERSPKDYKRIPDEMLLDDVREVAESLFKDSISTKEYIEHGNFSVQTILARFPSWNDVLEKAKLNKTSYRVITDEDLFEEIERLWRQKGEQPTTTDIKSGLSEYSLNTYSRRFGGWRKALFAFIEYIDKNTETIDNVEKGEFIETDTGQEQILLEVDKKQLKKRTRRDINLRLRFKVLQRDDFKCCACGASPAKDPSVELHVDHIIPWSKGGETVLENLQTLCSKCNLGKSDLFEE